MTDAAFQYAEVRSLGRHAWIGAICILLGLGGLGYWATITPISGAILASGVVVVEGGSQRVQHQEGGIVRKILVRNEDLVQGGQLLVSLDGTATVANLAVIQSQLSEAYVRRARLLAEAAQAPEMQWPAALDDLPDRDRSREMFEAEQRLRDSRASALSSQSAQLQEQVVAIEGQIVGLTAQRDAIAAEMAIVEPELERLEDLYSKGLLEVVRVTSLKREQTQLEGNRASADAEIARARATIAERNLQVSQLGDSFQSDVLSELQKINQSVAELLQQKIAAEDRLARLDIRAPIDGIVHESKVQTVGGVVGAGETLMQIVPRDADLHVDLRVNPIDIDMIASEQAVSLRFAGLNPRSAPDLTGTVHRISPDLSRDDARGTEFYVVRAIIDDGELSLLPVNTRLVPGMPVEGFFKTSDRTIISYLLDPIMERLSRVFRDE
jgi:HlyD family secretion protein